MVFTLNITDLWSRWTKSLIITLRNLTKYNKSKDIIKRENLTRVCAKLSGFFSLHADYVILQISASIQNKFSLIARRGKPRWLYWKWQAKFLLLQTQTYWVPFAFHLANLKKNFTEELDSTRFNMRRVQIWLKRSTCYNISLIKNIILHSISLQTTWSFYANLSRSPLCRTRVLSKHVLKAAYPLGNWIHCFRRRPTNGGPVTIPYDPVSVWSFCFVPMWQQVETEFTPHILYVKWVL